MPGPDDRPTARDLARRARALLRKSGLTHEDPPEAWTAELRRIAAEVLPTGRARFIKWVSPPDRPEPRKHGQCRPRPTRKNFEISP